MDASVKLETINDENLDRLGFFCYKSKRKTEGYAKKSIWVRDRLAEGMRLHILYENGVSKGFVEAMPGEYAWRAVNARAYLMIHCIWVVGKAKGNGYGSRLLEQCVQDASEMGLSGVAVLASEDTWLTTPGFFVESGFEVVDRASPAFTLLSLRINGGEKPSFPTNWQERIGSFGSDLTLVYADQCPYIARMKQAVHNVAESLKIQAQEVCLMSSEELQAKAPSPYGVYNVVFRGRIIATHPVGTDSLMRIVQSQI